jgi:hypothetical protein
MQNEELYKYASQNITRAIKLRTILAGHVARMGEMRNAYKILVGKPDGYRPLGGHKRKWEDNIRMHLGERGRDGVDWTHLAQERDQWRTLVNTVMNLRVP